MGVTIFDYPPAIGSEFYPAPRNGDWVASVIATGSHGHNETNSDIEQHVVLVVNHRSYQARSDGQQAHTYSFNYDVYIVERKRDVDNNPTDKWTVLYEQKFDNISDAVNGIQERHPRWATEAEKKEPKRWIAGFSDCAKQ